MESRRFDNLLRSLAQHRSRRATIGAALGSLFGTGSLVVFGKAEAKHKHKKKKKHKHNHKPAPPGGCATGTKSCAGACIPDDDCCSDADCTGDLTCQSGTCDCRADLHRCGETCNSHDECCGDSNCGEGQSCVGGACYCTESTSITCGASCCARDSEVCQLDHGVATCQPGACPVTDFCEVGEETGFLCAYSIDEETETHTVCVCAQTVDTEPQATCITLPGLFAPNCNAICHSSADCPAGSVCVPSSAKGACDCANNFCAPLCALDR